MLSHTWSRSEFGSQVQQDLRKSITINSSPKYRWNSEWMPRGPQITLWNSCLCPVFFFFFKRKKTVEHIGFVSDKYIQLACQGELVVATWRTIEEFKVLSKLSEKESHDGALLLSAMTERRQHGWQVSRWILQDSATGNWRLLGIDSWWNIISSCGLMY